MTAAKPDIPAMADILRLSDEVSFLVKGTPALTERERRILQNASDALRSLTTAVEIGRAMGREEAAKVLDGLRPKRANRWNDFDEAADLTLASAAISVRAVSSTEAKTLIAVPVEPTVEMVEAGRAALSQGDTKVQTHARVMWVWEAMINAARVAALLVAILTLCPSAMAASHPSVHVHISVHPSVHPSMHPSEHGFSKPRASGAKPHYSEHETAYREKVSRNARSSGLGWWWYYYLVVTHPRHADNDCDEQSHPGSGQCGTN